MCVRLLSAGSRNKYYGKTTRNAVRELRNFTDKAAAAKELPEVVSMIDKLAKRGIIHKNKAANLKGKLAKKIFATADKMHLRIN